MPTSFRSVMLLLCPALLLACTPMPGRQVAESNVISRAEIDQNLQTRSAFELIQKLRLHWLRPRGPGSLGGRGGGQVMVYVDGMLYGTIRALQDVMVADIHEIEHLSAAEATTHFGPDHTGGAILIRTRRE